MSSSQYNDNNPLRRLTLAEQETNEIIAREEAFRARRLQEAEHAAQEVYETRRAEEEAKFQAEVRATEGEGDEMVKQMLIQTEAEKKAQAESYARSKDAVVDLLLHHTTTCEVKLTESEIQAFLAIQRKKNAPTAEY